MKIDLHTHTNHSDGALTPSELIMRAQQMQLDVLAITDHDVVSGCKAAQQYIDENNIGIRLISGIELSASWHGFDIHILGLGVVTDNEHFLKNLVKQGLTRDERARKICAKLSRCGIQNVYHDAEKLANGAQISRNHIAQTLVNRTVCKTHKQAFTQYLGKGKRAFVSSNWISIETAVSWIKEAGGQAVLAHPSHYDMNTKWLRRLVSEFKGCGGEAMEVTHPTMSTQTKRLLAEIALENGLFASVGSDFHFPSRWTELGRKLSIDFDLTPIWHDWNL